MIFISVLVFLQCIFHSFADRQRQFINQQALNHGQYAMVAHIPRHLLELDGDWRSAATHSDDRTKNDNYDYTKHAKAQDKEDILLYENWFYGKVNGLVLESGAHDGIRLSLSKMFEEYAGWTTINVEADPTTFRKLKRNRIRSINVMSALCAEPRILHFTDSFGADEVRGIVEFMDPQFLKDNFGSVYDNRTSLNDLASMKCATVKGLLQYFGISHVDLWVLDVEGGEEDVLLGTDFNAVTFDAIVMECDRRDTAKDMRKMEYLDRKGYDCGQVDRNCFCKNRRFSPSSREVKSQKDRKYWDGRDWVSPPAGNRPH